MNYKAITKSFTIFAVIAIVFSISDVAFAQASPTVSIKAGDVDLVYGEHTDIYWYPKNATSCMAVGGTGGWAGSKYPYGGSFYVGAMYNTTTFSITCSNSYGSSSASVTVNVGPAPVSFPSIDLTIDNSSVAYGSSTTIRWNATNATSCTGTGGLGNWAGSKNIPSGSFNTGAVTSTSTYILNCINASGSSSKSVTLSVGPQPTPPTPQPPVYQPPIYQPPVYQPLPPTYNPNPCSTFACQPNAVTTNASNIDHNSARLNGIGTSYDGSYTNGHFEWGTTTSLGNSTVEGFIGNTTSSPFYSGLFGLSPNTTYYFRAVVNNQYGTARGEILSFRTGSIPVVNTNTTTTNVVYRDVVRNVVKEVPVYIPVTTNVAVSDTGDQDNNSLVGLALFGGDLWPDTLIGWLILLLLILLIVYVLRRIYYGLLIPKRKKGGATANSEKPQTLL